MFDLVIQMCFNDLFCEMNVAEKKFLADVGGGTPRLDADASSRLFFYSSNLKGAGSKQPTPFYFQSVPPAFLVPVGKTGT